MAGPSRRVQPFLFKLNCFRLYERRASPTKVTRRDLAIDETRSCWKFVDIGAVGRVRRLDFLRVVLHSERIRFENKTTRKSLRRTVACKWG